MADSIRQWLKLEAYDSSTFEPLLARELSTVTNLTQAVMRHRKYQVSSAVSSESISLGDIASAVGLFLTCDVPVTISFNGSAAAAEWGLSAAGWCCFSGGQIGSVYVSNDNAASGANLDLIAWY